MLPEDVVTIAMSDHGARPMMGGLCFNDWLIQEGYLVLKEPVREITPIAKADVDWSYGRVGRRRVLRAMLPEHQGAGAERHRRAGAVRNAAQRDGRQARGAARADGLPMGTKVHKPQEVYPEVRGVAPDLIVYFGDLDWRSVGAVGTPASTRSRTTPAPTAPITTAPPSSPSSTCPGSEPARWKA